MKAKSRIIVSLLLTAFATAPAWALNCSSPPDDTWGNAGWSKYQQWCRDCGGTPTSTGCTPGPNWGGSSSEGGGFAPPGGSDPELMMMQMFMQFGFDLIGKQIECLFNPDCGATAGGRQAEEQQRQWAEQQRLEREAQQRAAEEERRRQEAERRAKFEQTKGRLLGEMRLQPGTGTLQPRNLGLEVRETAGGLQARSLMPRDLAAAPFVGAASLRGPLARASCGAFLLRKADEAAGRGDMAEASFLSSEAAALMSGEKITTAVECPPPPEAPEIGEGREVPESAERTRQLEAALQQRSRFISAMYRRVADQGAEYRQTVEAMREAGAKKAETEAQLEEARARKAEMEAQLQQSAATVPATPSTEAVPVAKPDPAAESAMAEALAAMQAAEAALADAEAEFVTLAGEKAELEKQMQETRTLFDDVKKDPATMDKALEKLTPGSRKEI